MQAIPMRQAGEGLRAVSAVRSILVPCTADVALAAVWDIRNIEHCEVKADTLALTRETDWTGLYTIRGHFARVVPWTGTFRYWLHTSGFHSADAQPRPSGLHVSGGFVVAPVAGGCEITHYEDYRLAWWAVPLRLPIRRYLEWSQGPEMRALRGLILRGAATPAPTLAPAST